MPPFSPHHPPIKAIETAPYDRSMVTLSELEHRLKCTAEAHQRWLFEGMAKSGYPGLSSLEIAFLLDLANQHDACTFTALCHSARIDEPHLAHYALRKLRQRGLVETGRRGKEKTVALTQEGHRLHAAFHELNRNHITNEQARLPQLGQLVQALSDLTALYERARQQAAAPITPAPTSTSQNAPAKTQSAHNEDANAPAAHSDAAQHPGTHAHVATTSAAASGMASSLTSS